MFRQAGRDAEVARDQDMPLREEIGGESLDAARSSEGGHGTCFGTWDIWDNVTRMSHVPFGGQAAAHTARESPPQAASRIHESGRRDWTVRPRMQVHQFTASRAKRVGPRVQLAVVGNGGARALEARSILSFSPSN
jgi:hypothetical protein